MKIDKSLGRWKDDATFLEDVSYYLYLQYLKNYYESGNCTSIIQNYPTQHQFLSGTYRHDDVFFKNFFNQAKNIIRKEKLEILNENR